MKKVIKKRHTIYQGDCVEKMTGMLNDSIDLILTDPPYNLGLFMKKRDTNLGALRKNHFAVSNWDHITHNEWLEGMDIFFAEAARILKKKKALLMFMAVIKVESVILIAQKHGFYYKTTGVWHKTNPMPRNMNLHFINSTESWIYFIHGGKTGTFNNEGSAVHDFFETSVINGSEKKHGKHPTQKPLKMMEHFVRLLSNEDDIVLDPFMGSGSTGVATINLKRRFSGIELDEGYFKIAHSRLLESSKNV